MIGLLAAVGVGAALSLTLRAPTIVPVAAAAVPSGMAEMERDTVAPQIAPKDATVTMVVFSDYQCPYCHKLHPELRRLLADDHKIHFIYRDWPIFGDASIDAARLAIASQYQGRHEAFDDALSATTGKLDAAKIRAAAVKAGVNWARLQSDLVTHRQAIDQLLIRTDGYARAIGFQGTPGIVVGDYAMFGAQDLTTLKMAVAKARQAD
jgi:protein-disulfide isomerase